MKNILVILSIIGLSSFAYASRPATADTVNPQSEGNCKALLEDAKKTVAAFRASDFNAQALTDAQTALAAGATSNLTAAQQAERATFGTAGQLIAFTNQLGSITSDCSAECRQLASELRQAAQTAYMNQQNQLGQHYEQRAQAAEGDGESCQRIEDTDNNEAKGQLGDAMQMLPALMQLASMLGQKNPEDPGAAISDQERCIKLAEDKNAEGADESLNQAYADLCARMNDTAVASLGTQGGTPSAGLTSSRLGALADRNSDFGQGFEGGLEKQGQAAKVNTPSGGGSASLGGGRGGAVAGGKGRRGRGGKKLKTDIMKGTAGGGIAGGSSRGGSFGGGRRGPSFGRTNAERMKSANLKQYLPGGKKYRGPASVAKKGEVSAALGPSNFDKISQRYKKVQSTLLP